MKSGGRDDAVLEFARGLFDDYLDWREVEAHAAREATWARDRGEVKLAKGWEKVADVVKGERVITQRSKAV